MGNFQRNHGKAEQKVVKVKLFDRKAPESLEDNLKDLAKYFEKLLNGNIIKPETLTESA